MHEHPEIGQIDSGSKRRSRVVSQSEAHTPMMPVNLRASLVDHSAGGGCGSRGGSAGEDPRDWIKSEADEMMGFLKTATDECLVARLEGVEINEGVEI